MAFNRFLWLALGHTLLCLAGSSRAGALQATSILPPQNFTGIALSSSAIQWSWSPVLGSSTELGATHYELRSEIGVLIASIPSSLSKGCAAQLSLVRFRTDGGFHSREREGA